MNADLTNNIQKAINNQIENVKINDTFKEVIPKKNKKLTQEQIFIIKKK